MRITIACKTLRRVRGPWYGPNMPPPRFLGLNRRQRKVLKMWGRYELAHLTLAS